MTDKEKRIYDIKDELVTLGNELEHVEIGSNRLDDIQNHVESLSDELLKHVNEFLGLDDGEDTLVETDEVIAGYEKFMSPHAKDRIMESVLCRELHDFERHVEIPAKDDCEDYDSIYNDGYNDALTDVRNQRKDISKDLAVELIEKGEDPLVKRKIAEIAVKAIRNMSQVEIDLIRQNHSNSVSNIINLEL